MNYSAIYDSLIERASSRVLVGYQEAHHIVPKCLGGDDERHNLVNLTPEEHFLAHKLLVKMYPRNHKLVFAMQAMVWPTRFEGRNNNKLFGWAKRRVAEAKSAS